MKMTDFEEAPENQREITGPTRAQLKLIETAAQLRERPDQEFEDRAFAARELVQATLPHSEPLANLPIWSRANGNYTLAIRPGFMLNRKTGQQENLGYPYGSIPRLLLFWITTEAVRQKSQHLELGGSLNGFLRSIGLNPATGGGPRSDAKRLQNQMERLFRASISFDYADDRQNRWINMEITAEGQLFWDPKEPEQFGLWDSWIKLGERFFQAITTRPFPVDLRVLRALKQSPLALDLYAWLVHKNYAASAKGRPIFVDWKGLEAQLGGEYERTRDFRRAARNALKTITLLHDGRPLEEAENGLRILPGRLLVAPKLT
jgi:hypothetical protein